MTASADAANHVKSLAADVERALSVAGTATAEAVTAGAREAQSTLVAASTEAATQVKSLAADVQRSLSIAGTATAESITAGAREAQSTLMNASAEASSQVKSLAADVQRSLSMAGNATAESITTGAREAQNTLITASTEAANHVKSLAVDVERTLTAVGADTAASILGTAREAQSSFSATSADAANQIKAIAADMERSLGVVTASTTDTIQTTAQNAQSALVAATNEVSTKVKSTSADIERSVLAASSNFGSTMTGKTDEIVTYVQQQTDRLAQIVDSRRGSLVEALSTRTTQLTTDIDRVTADALKSIETRGRALAIDVDPRLGSRAHDHVGGRPRHRRGGQVAEGPRTGVAFGDRPVASGLDRRRHRNAGDQQDPAHRYGGAVRAAARRQHPAAGSADRRPRQPQLAGARAGDPRGRLRVRHERRHLPQRGRHADPGRPAHRLQQQDLEGAGGSRRTVERVREHGKELVEAAGVVEQANRTTSTSVADRKSQLESLVTTIDLRTTDLDQRLSRFTGLLDESLAAAEERARDIARVVAETAGAGSAAISRQFEAVRTAAENERSRPSMR